MKSTVGVKHERHLYAVIEATVIEVNFSYIKRHHAAEITMIIHWSLRTRFPQFGSHLNYPLITFATLSTFVIYSTFVTL